MVRTVTYPNTPWIRFLWGPMVRAARALTGATRFPWDDGSLRYGPPIGERTIELPVAQRFVERFRSARLLEIGNVMNHYRPFPHDVVDKYEPGAGIWNADVVDLPSEPRYPAILSVSTLEHVGFDETPRVSGKFVRAVRHLYHDCLEPGGELFVTLPLGYNPEVDAFVYEAPLELGRRTLYRRRGLRNLWEPIAEGRWPAVGALTRYDLRRHRLSYVVFCHAFKPQGAGPTPSPP